MRRVSESSYLWTVCHRILPGTVVSCLRGWRKRCRLSLSTYWSQSPRHPETANLKLTSSGKKTTIVHFYREFKALVYLLQKKQLTKFSRGPPELPYCQKRQTSYHLFMKKSVCMIIKIFIYVHWWWHQSECSPCPSCAGPAPCPPAEWCWRFPW